MMNGHDLLGLMCYHYRSRRTRHTWCHHPRLRSRQPTPTTLFTIVFLFSSSYYDACSVVPVAPDLAAGPDLIDYVLEATSKEPPPLAHPTPPPSPPKLALTLSERGGGGGGGGGGEGGHNSWHLPSCFMGPIRGKGQLTSDRHAQTAVWAEAKKTIKAV